MLFDKRDVSMTIIFLVISVNLITVNGPRTQGAGPSEPDSTSGEDYVGYSACWKFMKQYCKHDNPQAIDFVRRALVYWVDMDLCDQPRLRLYYHSFDEKTLDAGDILDPNDYCLSTEYGPMAVTEQVEENDNDDEDEPDPEDGVSKCQRILSVFGDTNIKALLYGYYKTKHRVLKFDGVDTPYMPQMALFMSHHKDYNGNYLKFMARHVKLKGNYQSPLDFCKEYDMQLKKQYPLPQNQ